MEAKRLTAIKTRAEGISKGKYIAKEGLDANYVVTPSGQRLSRIRLMATIVDKFISEAGTFASITLDDGTDTVRAKTFKITSLIDAVSVGDIVDVIGKIREYQGELYIVAEIIRRIDDMHFELLRELELKQQEEQWKQKRETIITHQKETSDLSELKTLMKERFKISPEEVEAAIEAATETPLPEESNKNRDKILELITSLDKGSGCDYTELITTSGLSDEIVDTAVNELLEEGVCYEPRPGTIKRL